MELAESADERRMFNETCERLGWSPLQKIASMLHVMHGTAPVGGSYREMMAIAYNEVTAAILALPQWQPIDGIRWARINAEPFEYAIQQGPHGDEFVMLLNGARLHRPIPTDTTLASNPDKRLLQLKAQRDALNVEIERHIDKWVKSIQTGGAA